MLDGRKPKQPAQLKQRLDIVLECQIGDARLAAVRYGAAQFLVGHGLVRYRLHHVGAGHEHVGRILDHEDEVGHGGRIDRAAGARSHDRGDLRHDAGRVDVALKHLGVAGERRDAFLNPSPTGIVEADDRRADQHGLVHDLADLLGVRFRERAAEYREILAERENQPAVHRAVAGDDAVAGDFVLVDAEIVAAVFDEHVPFLEGTGIEQHVEPLARRQLALGVLLFDALLAAAQPRGGALFLKLAQNVGHCRLIPHCILILRSGRRPRLEG